MTIHFHVNEAKDAARACRERLAARLPALGITETSRETEADVIVVLGGDGTFLQAVHAHPGVPLMGVKFGGLGYLANVAEGDAFAALEALAAGRYRVSTRRLLSLGGHLALNDIVLAREMSGHLTLLDLSIDGRFVAQYMADGLIFATPTGSTAYSLAAGGPVVMPDSGSFVVTPLNPHALGVRPLVVNDGVTFRVTVHARTAGNKMQVGVYADGERVRTLGEGDSVEITKGAAEAKLVELEGVDPYSILARKLGWSGKFEVQT